MLRSFEFRSCSLAFSSLYWLFKGTGDLHSAIFVLRFWCRFESSIYFLAGGQKSHSNDNQLRGFWPHGLSKSARLQYRHVWNRSSAPQNCVQNTHKYNLAAKPSVYSDLGAQKITFSWKIMATSFKIDAIAYFHIAKCQNMATINCISVWSAIFPWAL